MFDAAEALRGGLVESVEAPDALLARAREIAREIAEQTAPIAVALTRQMLWRFGTDPTFDATLAFDAAVNRTLGAGPDVREGVAAFLERRRPEFPGRISADMPPEYPWWTPR